MHLSPFFVTSPDVDVNGFGTYNVSVARDGLSQGTYSSSLTFQADTQTVQITVILQVGFSSSNTGGGYHYILLVDPTSMTSLQEFSSSGVNGLYSFHFNGLLYGNTYSVYAGTDPNNDYSICTQGEACGAYLSLDVPVELTVSDNVSNVDFTTDIQLSIPNSSMDLPSQDASRSLPEAPEITRGNRKIAGH